jgi:hypothetical protein
MEFATAGNFAQADSPIQKKWGGATAIQYMERDVRRRLLRRGRPTGAGDHKRHDEACPSGKYKNRQFREGHASSCPLGYGKEINQQEDTFTHPPLRGPLRWRGSIWLDPLPWRGGRRPGWVFPVFPPSGEAFPCFSARCPRAVPWAVDGSPSGCGNYQPPAPNRRCARCDSGAISPVSSSRRRGRLSQSPSGF